MQVLALILLVLIALTFIGMTVGMFSGNYNLFFILGAVLVVLIVLGLFLIRVINRQEKEAAEKRTDAEEPQSEEETE